MDQGQELILVMNEASNEAVDWGHPMMILETLRPFERAMEGLKEWICMIRIRFVP